MAITIQQLNDAEEDVGTIAEVANSTDPTTTTRLGAEIPTLAGLAAQFPNAEPAAAAAAASADAAAASVANASAAARRARAAADGIESGTTSSTERLLFEEDQGLAIDVVNDSATEVRVIDMGAPSNNYAGSLSGFIDTSVMFPTPRLCKQDDGTYKYNDHNDALHSADLSNASWVRTNMNPVAGQVGPDGVAADACLLTSTGTASSSASQVVNLQPGRYRLNGFKVKKGTASFAYIAITNNAVTRRAYFNLTTGAFATVDAGLTVMVSTVDEDGRALAAGWYFIAAYHKPVGSSDTVRLGLCNADNNVAVTNGVTMLATHAQAHYGVRRLRYMVTTAAVKRGAPYDWTNGERQVRLDPAITYAARSSDDWTNVTYWTSINVIAALDAVGPHGAPCSSITATANDGTISQAVTVSGTAQLCFAWIRRKTGAGTLRMSLDNGVTSVDVTSMVGPAGGEYGLVYRKGSVANPTVQFIIGTSGDAFEVALFNAVAAVGMIPPPNPSDAINFTTTTDTLSIATTKFPSAAEMTFYADVFWPPEAKGVARRTRMGFVGAGSLASTVDINVQVTETRIGHNSNDGTARDWVAGTFIDGTGKATEVGGRLQVQHRIAANDYAVTVNGAPTWWNKAPGAIAFTSFNFTVLQSLWLSRLVIVPRAISDETDDLRRWHLDSTDSNIDPNILATAVNARAHNTVDGADYFRIPGIEVLYERGDVCGFITVSGQHHGPGYNADTPLRAVTRRWEFDRSTNTFTPLSAGAVAVERPGWSTDTGQVMGNTPVKIKYGPYRGRLLLITMEQDSVSGTPVDDRRNIYLRYSDDNGQTWSAGVKILEKNDFTPGAGWLGVGENSTSFQFADGPHAGRVYVSVNILNQSFGAMWCDDFKEGGNGTGATWSITTTRIPETGGLGSLSEPAISYWPDHTIVVTLRSTSSLTRAFATSTDYGVTFGAPQIIHGENDSVSVNAGFMQDDPSGQLGRRGRLLLAMSTADYRIRHKIMSSYDDALTFGDTYRLFSPQRYVGYCPLRKAFVDDEIYLMMFEAAAQSTNPLTVGGHVSHQLVAFRYPRAT